jgi:uroporphyrinogen-III synthase
LPERENNAVLITRPEPAAHETAARVAALGRTPILAPMLRVRPLAATFPAEAEVIVLTSRNGLLGLPPSFHHLQLFAVGSATAALARNQGFSDVTSAEGNAEDLAALVAASLPPARRILLPVGRGQGAALAASLRAAGHEVHVRHVYEAEPVRALPAEARDALAAGRIGATLFFSAETARAFLAALRGVNLETISKQITACAISPTVAVALGALPWRRLRVAARPTQDDLLALLE